MKWLLINLVLFCGSVSSNEEISSYIVGGEDASIFTYPYMAMIQNLGRFSCGGSIISTRSVLTAAHCIGYPSLPFTVSVTVGTTFRVVGGNTHRALRVAIHPDYLHIPDPFWLQADVAVIRTITRINFGLRTQPIPLGEQYVPDLRNVVVTGWGLTNSTIIDPPVRLQRLSMYVIPNIICANFHVQHEIGHVVTGEKMCLLASDERGVCAGDSGGPVVLNGEVVGVANWTIRPCGTGPGVYLRVSEHIVWIRQQL